MVRVRVRVAGERQAGRISDLFNYFVAQRRKGEYLTRDVSVIGLGWYGRWFSSCVEIAFWSQDFPAYGDVRD